MAGRMSFKSDESFVEKLAMGAVGAQATMDDLARCGHMPIELERGSRSYKVWKRIKIKRLRMPDLLCVRCALRFESRGKATLQVSMSHSLSDPQRGWDSGLGDDDFVALVWCRRTGPRPTDFTAAQVIHYVRVADLRAAHAAGDTIVERPKGASEGFEARICWPSKIANAAAVVDEVSETRISMLRRSDGRRLAVTLTSRGVTLRPLVSPKDIVDQGQILASVVGATSDLPCQRELPLAAFISRATSPQVTERYAAVKALRHFRDPQIRSPLRGRMLDPDEHIYVRLEAASGLVLIGTELRGSTSTRACAASTWSRNLRQSSY